MKWNLEVFLGEVSDSQRIPGRGAARVSCPGKDTGDLNVGCRVESVRQVGGGGFASYIVIGWWAFE